MGGGDTGNLAVRVRVRNRIVAKEMNQKNRFKRLFQAQKNNTW